MEKSKMEGREGKNRAAGRAKGAPGILAAYIYWFLLIAALLLPSAVKPQKSYPVQVNVVVLPPYSVYLTDYYTRGSEKLKVQLLLKDLARPTFPVKLRFKLEGTALRLSSRSGISLPPFMLQAGELVEASGEQLAPYLSIDALVPEGADAAAFQRVGQRLPDGFYKLEVWAEEMARSVRVSNVATVVFSTMLYQSPIITTPADRALLPDQGIQNVVFQWMPRHLGASTDVAQSTFYRIRLVEIWPKNRDPQDAIRSSRPLFEGLSSSTTFIYGPGQPTLISGRKYALQVQAQDAEQRDLFVGQGFSNVVTFTYGEECTPPQGLNISVTGPGTAEVSWSANPRNSGYTLSYREVYGTDTSWVDQSLGLPLLSLSGLKPITSYRVRVAASCGLSQSIWSQPQTFTTSSRPEVKFECGKGAARSGVTDRMFFPGLKAGATFTASDFTVEVLVATPTPNGYTGSGIVRIPFFRNAPAYCSFKNVKVNRQLQLYDGSLVLASSVTLIDSKMVDEAKRLGKDVAKLLKDKNPANDVIVTPVSGTVTSVTTTPAGGGDSSSPSGGTTTVTVTTSQGQRITAPAGSNSKLVDESGSVVAVSRTGAVTKAVQDKNAFGSGVSSYEGATTATGTNLPKVELTPDTSEPYYGYDTTSDSEPWASIQTGSSVAVTARVDLQQSPLKAEEIRYRTGDGLVVESTGTNPATLDVKGLWSGIALPVLAVADTGREEAKRQTLILGKLNTVSYDAERRRVWLVPVNGATADREQVSRTLNAIYRQGVVEWEVQHNPSEVSLTLTPGELQALTSGIEVGALSSYTLPMQAALRKFGREPEEKTYLLFLVPGRAGNDVKGFMPLNRSAGFIFTEGQSGEAVARTIAHELGHGAFGLDHVGFAADRSQPTTDNLMDYGTGTTLTKVQWDAMHSEYRRLTWFQGSEEGKDVIKVNLKKLVDGLKAGRSSTEKRFTYTENDYLTLIQDAATFVTKAYEPVKLEDGTSLNLAVEFTAKSGHVDLSLSEDGVYNSIGISIDLKEKYHTQFNVRFYNQQKELLFKIWATSYEDFTAFLSYVGWNFTPKSRGKVVELYRNATNQAKDDPDKLDVIFETAPPFVLESFSDAEKWLFIRLLNGSSKDQVGTDEYKVLVNLLSSLSPQSLFTQNEQDASLLAAITQHCSDRSLSSLLYAFTHAGSKIWSDALLNAAGYTYTYKKEVGRSLPENFVGDPSKWYVLGGGAGASSNAGFSTTYELGVDAIEYDSEKSSVANKSVEVSRKRYAFYDPVLVNVTDEFSLMVPAFAAYQLVKSSIGKERNEMLNFGLTVLLPEVNLKAFRMLGRVFREVRAGGGKWLDNIYITQKNIISQWKNAITNATNIRKGNFCEMACDVYLSEKNFQPLHTRIQSIDAPTRKGIDGVFKKGNEYIIVEVKYKGTATLGNTADGKQMSNGWILSSNRLENSVGIGLADDIRSTGFRRILAEVSSDGSIVYKELDANANVIGIFNP